MLELFSHHQEGFSRFIYTSPLVWFGIGTKNMSRLLKMLWIGLKIHVFRSQEEKQSCFRTRSAALPSPICCLCPATFPPNGALWSSTCPPEAPSPSFLRHQTAPPTYPPVLPLCFPGQFPSRPGSPRASELACAFSDSLEVIRCLIPIRETVWISKNLKKTPN